MNRSDIYRLIDRERDPNYSRRQCWERKPERFNGRVLEDRSPFDELIQVAAVAVAWLEGIPVSTN